MKLPEIVQQPVGEFASGNIPIPRYDKLGEAVGNLALAAGKTFASIQNEKLVGDVDEATGQAAKELSELRAILVNSNTVDADWVGEDALGELQVSTVRNGDRETDVSTKMFTHEIAEDVWSKRSQEIIEYYASTLKNPKLRGKFVGEMNERYAAPGTQAVMAANIIRSRAYGQARAERSIEDVLASDAPAEVRESNAREIISRQLLMGADAVWAETELSKVGPAIDQIDVYNEMMGASTEDEVDQIEEEMWSGGNRMTPEQRRTMSVKLDQRRVDFKQAHAEQQDQTAGQLLTDFVNGDLTTEQVAAVRSRDGITQSAAWTFINGLKASGGATVKASNPLTLSQYRGEIFKLQYTGGTGLRVRQKAKLLKLQISRGMMGLTPQGVPTGQPPTISGEDAAKLNKDIDSALKSALNNESYNRAMSNVQAWTRTKLDLEGQFVTQLKGNQNQVEAAVAFKTALDNYMDQYGADADPVSFFESNKDAYDPRNFADGVNGSFLEQVPQVAPFITETDDAVMFNTQQQENFTLWLSDQVGVMSPQEFDRISTLFDQYYMGKGRVPEGTMMLEPEDPLYHQFEQMPSHYE